MRTARSQAKPMTRRTRVAAAAAGVPKKSGSPKPPRGVKVPNTESKPYAKFENVGTEVLSFFNVFSAQPFGHPKEILENLYRTILESFA